jgi:hypothetical protein
MNPQIEHLYSASADAIHKAASWAATAHGIDHSDALSVCHDAFLETVRAFDPAKGAAFATVLHGRMRWRLLDAVAARTQRELHEQPVEESAEPSATQPAPWRDALAGLSDEARLLVDLFVETPNELLSEVRSVYHLVAAVRSHLCQSCGWSRETFLGVFAEARRVLRQEGVV